MNTSWSDPNDRAVLEDQLLERGGRYPPLPPYTKSGDGYGYGDGGGGGIKKHNHSIRKGIPVMREGLNIIVSPGGYSPYVRIGWCRRVEGDEWLIIGARIIRRFGRNQQLVNLAANGPVVGKDQGENTDMLDAATEASPIHRLHAIRCEPANEKAWAKVCPKPSAKTVRSAVEKALAEMRGTSDWAAE